MSEKPSISETLKTLREKNKLTKKEMAEIAHISAYQYGLMEDGEISLSIVLVLMKVCDKFNLTLDYFMTYPEPEIYHHEELYTSDKDELVKIIFKYLKKLDLQSLKILYCIIILLQETNRNKSTI